MSPLALVSGWTSWGLPMSDSKSVSLPLLRSWSREHTYAGEGTVVPEVALVGEAVADETELALLDVLLDGVQEVIFGDLYVPGDRKLSKWVPM